jgi:prepilin-type N-terminal cleavage/methylation domain-containing protein
MLSNITQTKRGFTLIELLVVIAIIGILSSVVLASLGTARQKARDATRISDMKNIQLALELYYDSLQAYPANLEGAPLGTDANLSSAPSPTNVEGKLLGAASGVPALAGFPTFIPRIPSDPSGSPADYYRYIGTTGNAECVAAAGCQGYVLGATLETANNVLGTDDDTVAINGFFQSLGATCNAAAPGTNGPGGTERCYSIRP